MFTILITGHTPTINERDIPRDVTIEVYLDKVIDSRSITQNNIIVTDHLYRPVKGVVGIKSTNPGTPEGAATILTFRPEVPLDPETTYNVTVSKFPDSVKALDGSYIQNGYVFSFSTGINFVGNDNPTVEEQLEADLETAVGQENWCTAAEIQAILDGEDSACGCPLPESGTLPDYLQVTNTYPNHMDSDIPLEELRFIRVSFNDMLVPSGVDYAAYVHVTTQNVLE